MGERFHSTIPFHAYPWGKFLRSKDKILIEKNICPLRADGKYNINDNTQLHREYLPKI